MTLTSGTSTTFQVSLQALNGFTGTASVQVSNLPTGVTLSPGTSFSVSAANPQTVTVNVASSVAAASYSAQITATSGTLTHSATESITVQAPVNPDFSLTLTPPSLTLPPGAQGSFQISFQPSGGFSSPVQIQISGLPAGATISPAVAFDLYSTAPQTVTLAAANTLAAGSYSLTITAVSGSLSHSATESVSIATSGTPLPSRADFVRTDDDPGDAVYDQTHQCVYVTNPVAGTVDVISSVTYQILRRIPVPSPAGIDISPDNSTVFIGTGTQALYVLDTASMALTAQYLAPLNQLAPTLVQAQPPQAPVAAPDGTVLISLSGQIVKWNPSTNQTSTVSTNPPAPFTYGLAEGPMARSIGHAKVILSNDLSTSTVYLYDTTNNTFSAPLTIQGYAFSVAANPTGTQFAVAWVDNTQELPWTSFYDASLDLLTTIAGAGNVLYGNDGTTLYEAAIWYGQDPGVGLIDTTTFALTAVKPLYASQAGNGGGVPVLTVATPLAADETGRVFSSANHGLSIDDMTDTRSYSSSLAYPIYDLFAVPDNGPLGQQETVELETDDQTTIPGIWFGPYAGTIPPSQGSYLTAIAPASNLTGPVNIRVEDPGDVQAWMPQAYSYGPVLSPGPDLAASAAGGTPVSLFGYGLGNNAAAPGSETAGASVTFNGSQGTVSSGYSAPQSAPGPYPFPFPLWDFTVETPAVSAGEGNIVFTGASGIATLPNAYHALNMPSYAFNGIPLAMVYDPTRNQLYIAVASQIDVFSLSSKSFTSTIQVPTLNNETQLGGLALTPDGKDLIVANWADASVAVIDPDSPASATAVAVGIMPSASPYNQGPNELAATNTGLVFIGVGAAPATIPASAARRSRSTPPAVTAPQGASPLGATPENSVWVLNLGSMTAAPYTSIATADGAPEMAASPDGSQVCFVGEYIRLILYDSAAASLTLGTGGNACAATPSLVATTTPSGTSVSNSALLETSASSLLDYQQGAIGANTEPFALAIQSTGALLYALYSNAIAIFDAHTGEYRESISTQGSFAELLGDNGAIAIDNTGTQIFVFTADGLTNIQLDSLPLAIGNITVSGTTWTIAGTGFVSATAASADGNPLAVEFTDSQHLQVTAAPALNSIHTLTLTNPDGHTYTYDVAYLL